MRVCVCVCVCAHPQASPGGDLLCLAQAFPQSSNACGRQTLRNACLLLLSENLYTTKWCIYTFTVKVEDDMEAAPALTPGVMIF